MRFQAHLEQLTSAMHFGMMDIPGDEADLSSLICSKLAPTYPPFNHFGM